jgi:hypothetical protein
VRSEQQRESKRSEQQIASKKSQQHRELKRSEQQRKSKRSEQLRELKRCEHQIESKSTTGKVVFILSILRGLSVYVDVSLDSKSDVYSR